MGSQPHSKLGYLQVHNYRSICSAVFNISLTLFLWQNLLFGFVSLWKFSFLLSQEFEVIAQIKLLQSSCNSYCMTSDTKFVQWFRSQQHLTEEERWGETFLQLGETWVFFFQITAQILSPVIWDNGGGENVFRIHWQKHTGYSNITMWYFSIQTYEPFWFLCACSC